jgi:outer membrane immunogenic protein
MRITRSLLGGVALAAMAMSSALAADLPARSAPPVYVPPPPLFTWTGFYIGLNAGAAIRSTNNNNSNAALFFGFPVFGNNNNGNNNVAFVGGGQIGYNWQTGAVVWGLEADAQYRSSFGNNNNGFFGGGGGGGGSGGYLGTVRGRLGYLFTPALLAYVTGGLAYGSSYYSTPFFFFSNANNSLRVGYTVGGGLEYMVTPNWSIKAEYLWTDLGRSNSNNFLISTPRSQAHVVRAGINYHFNWGAPAAVVARY